MRIIEYRFYKEIPINFDRNADGNIDHIKRFTRDKKAENYALKNKIPFFIRVFKHRGERLCQPYTIKRFF
jgi:hypothetical protein